MSLGKPKAMLAASLMAHRASFALVQREVHPWSPSPADHNPHRGVSRGHSAIVTMPRCP